MSSTITIQNVVDYARAHTKLIPVVGVGGISNEPALSIANDVMGEVLNPPYPWKWNRAEPQFLVTQQFKQDYLYAGATAFVLGPGGTGGGVGVGLASNTAITEASSTVTVNTLEAHNFAVGATVFMFGNTVAAYNSSTSTNGSSFTFTGGWTITAVPTSTSFTFTHSQTGLAASGAPGISDFGWLESASVRDINNTTNPQPTQVIEAVKAIPINNAVGNPEKVCVISDLGTGVIKVRFWPTPGTYVWGVQLAYQKQAPLLTSLSATWGPIPDSLAFVYRQGFLAHAYRFADDVRAQIEYQKFQMNIAKALSSTLETDESCFYPSRPILLG